MITIAEAHVDDVGTEIRLNVTDGGVPVDLTGATELTIRLRKPSGATVDKPAFLVGAVTDGVINCYTAAGDLDEAGNASQSLGNPRASTRRIVWRRSRTFGSCSSAGVRRWSWGPSDSMGQRCAAATAPPCPNSTSLAAAPCWRAARRNAGVGLVTPHVPLWGQR